MWVVSNNTRSHCCYWCGCVQISQLFCDVWISSSYGHKVRAGTFPKQRGSLSACMATQALCKPAKGAGHVRSMHCMPLFLATVTAVKAATPRLPPLRHKHPQSLMFSATDRSVEQW